MSVLSLADVAERFGWSRRSWRKALGKLQAIEAESGRKLLTITGRGRAKRYVVREAALDAVLEGADEFDRLAAKVADQVNAMNERLTLMSLRLEAAEKELRELRKLIGKPAAKKSVTNGNRR